MTRALKIPSWSPKQEKEGCLGEERAATISACVLVDSPPAGGKHVSQVENFQVLVYFVWNHHLI